MFLAQQLLHWLFLLLQQPEQEQLLHLLVGEKFIIQKTNFKFQIQHTKCKKSLPRKKDKSCTFAMVLNMIKVCFPAMQFE